MRVKAAEKVLKKKEIDATIGHANEWTGSKDACHRAGVDPAKKWAYSTCHDSRIYEPVSYFDTVYEIVDKLTKF